MDSFTFFLSTLFSLAGVVLVIYLAYRTSRFLASRYSAVTCGKFMRVLDRIVIGQNQYLVLVETGGEVILVGVTAQGMENLGRMKREDLREMENPTPDLDFAKALSQVMKQKFAIGRDRDAGEDGQH